MPEPKNNPNSRLLVDPPWWFRHITKLVFDPMVNQAKIDAKRKKAEAQRVRSGDPHVVEYFHQLDDPYSHLAVQTLEKLASRYDIKILLHLIRATGGKNQPEEERLAAWARTDAGLIAPHLGFDFPSQAPIRPSEAMLRSALARLSATPEQERMQVLPAVSAALWEGRSIELGDVAPNVQADALLDAGSERLQKLGHYSGGMFYYGGEWYWGVDRLHHLEQRLRDLGACADPSQSFICVRPDIDVEGVDASALELDFYPSLNSPYTAIIYDKTIEMAKACGIRFNHKPVLPMIMRGVPATREKAMYIMFDTKREAKALGAQFGPVMVPIGEPVRKIYSLLPWATSLCKDTQLLSAALNLAFGQGVGLHREAGVRKAVEAAGLDWKEAKARLGDESWKPVVERAQKEMTEELGLWGVPSYRLRGGGDGEKDLCVWGQDRLWLIAKEIKRRVASLNARV